MEAKNKIMDIIRNNVAWVLLICLCAIFSIASDSFLSVRNILNIINQNAYLLIGACGVSLLMMSGKMDLSIGYATCVNAVICARLMTELHMPAVIIMIAGVILGVLFELFNVVISQKLKITHMFVSFGTMTICQGLAYVISDSKTVGNFPDSFKMLGQGRIVTIFGGNITFAIAIMIICVAAVSFVLNKTYFGRYVFAIGGNKDAARLAGIDVNKMEIYIGIICGACCGFATMILISRIGSASATSTVDMTFTIITGLLVGGVSVRGGEGKIGGCVAGIFAVAILGNGMMMVGLNPYYQYVVKGAIMLITIALDNLQLQRRDRIRLENKEKNAREKLAAGGKK